MKILLTGASGFIGTNFILRFYKNYEIVALVRENSNTKLLESKCKIYRYKSCEDLANYLRDEVFDGVLHLATLYIKSHTKDNLRDIIDSNITFGVEILEALARIDFMGFFINIGTFWQFYKNMPSNPLNLYAASKSAFEEMIYFYQNTTNINFSTIYLNDTYGANDTRPKIFNLWQKIAKSGERLEMSGGEQLIDMLYIDDVLDAFKILIDICLSPYATLAKNKIFTLHSNERKTLRELASIFEEVLGAKLNIIWGAKEYMQRENFIPFEGGEKLPLWEQKVSFKEGIVRILKMGGGI